MSSSPPQIRLTEVARRAGVSVVTVSRALRTPAKVAAETRARIDAAVQSLGYVPNLVAGALASARTRTVALLVPTIASSIFATTINGLTDALEQEGFTILLAQSGYDPGRERAGLAALLGRRPEALVMVGEPLTEAAHAMLEAAAARGTFVVETWDLPDAPIGAAVGFDNAAVGAAVAARFAASGRQRLAFVGGGDQRAGARWRGFSSTAERLNLAPPVRIKLPAPAVVGDAAAALAESDGRFAQADAIFAATDVHAFGLLAGLRARGRRVPEEVAVIGLGDLEMARYTIPPLTTVFIDGAAMGRQAASLILSAVSKDGSLTETRNHSIDLGFTLIERESA